MDHPGHVVYKGITYKRNPNSESWPKRVYYQAPRKSGRGYLHRDLYADTYGPIPPGLHVHHRDHDPFNNDPANLVLMTPEEHRRHHGAGRKFDEARMQIHRETTLVAAAKWHGSDAGLALHRDLGRKTWENREARKGIFTCPECGVEHEGYFPTKSGPERFCSGRCRQRVERREGKYRRAAICPVCSATFQQGPNLDRPKTCSSRCGALLRWHGPPSRVT